MGKDSKRCYCFVAAKMRSRKLYIQYQKTINES